MYVTTDCLLLAPLYFHAFNCLIQPCTEFLVYNFYFEASRFELGEESKLLDLLLRGIVCDFVRDNYEAGKNFLYAMISCWERAV